jgi:hypothetical protein
MILDSAQAIDTRTANTKTRKARQKIMINEAWSQRPDRWLVEPASTAGFCERWSHEQKTTARAF